MKLVLTIVCSIVALAVGDVAHLERNYLPPSRTVAYNSAQGYAAGGNKFAERLTQFQVVPSTSYALPAAPLTSYSSSSTFNTGYRAPARLIAPSASAGYETQRFSSARLVAPARQYLSPEFETSPARFTAPSASAGYETQRFSSARLGAPARQYLSPEVETFEPIVQQAYSAPTVTYSAPAASFSAASANLDTKYSADGGYVY